MQALNKKCSWRVLTEGGLVGCGCVPRQNFWFRLQVELPEDPSTGKRLVLGPFMPSEQHLALEATHYQLEQEFALAGP